MIKIQSLLLLCFVCTTIIFANFVLATDEVHNKEPIPINDEDDGAPVPPGAEVGLDFFQAFVKSLAVIIVTELGDKTFFIAAVSLFEKHGVLHK
jgi:hypothetical protein